MIFKIARKEFVEMRRDGRFALATTTVLILLVASLAVGWRNYQETRRQQQAAAENERFRWLNIGNYNPHSAAHYGTYVFKPQLPLSVVDNGVDPYAGVASHLEAHTRNIFQFKPAEDSTAVRRFGEMTASVTLQILIPLLLVMLLYNSFVGEREAGTLRQLASLGVSNRDLAIGKLLGIALPLILLLVPVTLLGAIALWLNSGNDVFAMTAPRIALMTLAYLLYFAVFICFTLAVSARAKSSRQTVVVLLAFWFFNCLAAPQIVSGIARSIFPAPSALSFFAAIRVDATHEAEALKLKEKESPTSDAERIARLNQKLGQYGILSGNELPADTKAMGSAEGEQRSIETQDRHFRNLFDAYEKQNKIYQAGGIIAPMLGVQTFSQGLAGTDFAQHRHFSDAAENYRRYLVQSLNWDLAVNDTEENRRPHPLSPSLMWYQPGEELWSRIAPFEYRAPDTSWVIKNNGLSIAVLLLWFGAAVAFARFLITNVRVD
jgi:ABC-2 type transport system permease protein